MPSSTCTAPSAKTSGTRIVRVAGFATPAEVNLETAKSRRDVGQNFMTVWLCTNPGDISLDASIEPEQGEYFDIRLFDKDFGGIPASVAFTWSDEDIANVIQRVLKECEL